MAASASVSAAIATGPAGRNKDPILQTLQPLVQDIYQHKQQQQHKDKDKDYKVYIVEVASGSGEHAAYFAEKLQEAVLIQPTEPQIDMHISIKAWTENLTNVLPPLHLGVEDLKSDAPLINEMKHSNVDIIICINMIHISPIECTYALFESAKSLLVDGGIVFLYGPYRVNGFMVESNVKFDESLKSRNPSWGVRDLEDVQRIAAGNGFEFVNSFEMPANNLSVVFRKIDEKS